MTASRSSRSVRRTLLFTGHVQGVGFRYTTESIASRFAVTGFVRNLVDGRVEVVVEGAESELDCFVQAIEQELGRNIRKIHAHDTQARSEFESFQITV